MLYFSSLLKTTPQYSASAQNLFAALDGNKIKYDLLPGTRDVWMRDFMPVRIWDKHISFRYEPSYLKDQSQLRTDFRRDISGQFNIFDGSDPDDVIYSDINLDGGNVVFSPSKERAIISDRVFSENPGYDRAALVRELEELLRAQVIIIPSLSSDMTGHADGMVRFVDNNTVVGNATGYQNGLEQRIKEVLSFHGINTIDFPYFPSAGESAAGCYLNFLVADSFYEADRRLLLPVFGHPMDEQAVRAAEQIFLAPVIPVRIDEIARDGGGLNCISWEIRLKDTVKYRDPIFPLATCPVCGEDAIPEDWICDRCGWQYDGTSENGAFSELNGMTLGEYKQRWRKKCGKENLQLYSKEERKRHA